MNSGKLQYKGKSDFLACETGQNGGSNIYTTNSTSVTQCKNIQLSADKCSGNGSGAGGSSSAAPSMAHSSVPLIPSSSAPAGGAQPSGPAGGAQPSGPAGGAQPSGPAGGAQPSGPAGGAQPSGPAGGSQPSGPAGGAQSSGPAGGAQPSGHPASGSGSGATMVHTVTVNDCGGGASTGAPAPSGGAQPSGPAGGAQPSGPAGGAQPSGPAGGSQPSGPAGGAQPSGPAGGAQPSGPAGGSQPSHSQGGPAPSAPHASVTVSPKPSTMATVPASAASGSASSAQSAGGSCPTTLTSGSYEFPHLIVPVNSSSPDTASGTSYFGTVSPSVSSIFNFDVPSSDSGKTCSLVFLFPKKEDLETSDYSFSGDGKIDIAKLSKPASESTTSSNMPSVSQDLGQITISPGNSYVVSTFSCPAGETVAYEMKDAGDTNLHFFQDYNPSPYVFPRRVEVSEHLLTCDFSLGLYITTC